MTPLLLRRRLQPPSADTNVIKAAIERINLADHEEEEEI